MPANKTSVPPRIVQSDGKRLQRRSCALARRTRRVEGLKPPRLTHARNPARSNGSPAAKDRRLRCNSEKEVRRLTYGTSRRANTHRASDLSLVPGGPGDRAARAVHERRPATAPIPTYLRANGKE